MQIKKEQQKTDGVKKEFIKETILAIIGKPGEEVVDFLDPDKYVNEFLIAKKFDNNINQTRNLLYKLSEHSLVSSIRKKDKKKGWYTYFWKLETLKVLEFLREMLRKRIDQINHQIESREMKTFYICERCGIEHNEENALLHDFTCNECGSVFAVRDNTKVVKEFRRNLEKQKREMEIVEEKIREEKEKDDRKKIKEIKKEEKEKVKKRLEKKKERDLLKKGEEKVKKKIPLHLHAKKSAGARRSAKKIKSKKISKKRKR